MKKIILLALLFTGCSNDPISTEIKGKGIKVEYMFEKDGVRVYRFYDCGRTHYFTTIGETITQVDDGHNNYHDENIKLK